MRHLVLLALTVLLLAASPDVVAQENSHHKLRLGFTLASVTGGFSTQDSTEGFFVDTTTTTTGSGGSAIGFRLGYEYRPISRIGVALDVERASVDIRNREVVETETFNFFGPPILDRIAGVSEGRLQLTPITIGLHVYLSSGRRHEWYVGPTIGYVLYDRLEQDGWRGIVDSSGDSVYMQPASPISLDDDKTFGAVTGLDLKLSKSKASFHVSVAYLGASADGTDAADGFSMDVDPILARMGVVFRY